MKLSFFKENSTVTIFSVIIILIIIIIASRNIKKSTVVDDSQTSKPVVSLINTKNYGQGIAQVSANGTVESLEQADLRSQATGKVTKINVKVGQRVNKGDVLATLEQSNQLAALTSAKGSLAQAQANYNKVQSGASNEDIAVAQVSLDNAKSALDNTQKQQQVLVDSAFKTLMSSGLVANAGNNNTGSVTATISGTYNSSQPGNYKVTVYSTSDGIRYQISGTENYDALAKTYPQPLGNRGLFIQFSSTDIPINNSWTISVPNTQSSSYTANNNAYQTALETQKSSVTAAQNAVTQAQAALALKKSQARPADLEAAQAQILSAQGLVQSAQAALDNTIISAPFNGVISAVPVKFADLVTAGSNVVSIVNPQGLQVKIFVSNIDLSSIHPGDPVKIGKNESAGTVANVAPSVNANTKTAEVDVTVDDPNNSTLTVGQNVSVVIAGKNQAVTTSNSFLLPIQAVKITPDGHNYAYKLNEQSKAVQVEVQIGNVDGEHIEVTGGIENDTNILSNAYGISNGDDVKVQ